MRPAWFSNPTMLRCTPSKRQSTSTLPMIRRVARERLQVDEAGAEDLVALVPEVAVPEQLVAAADREQRRALGQRLADARHLAAQLVGDQHLVAILAAADEDDVGAVGVEGVAEAHRPRPAGRAPRQRARCSSTRTLPRSA